MMLIFKRTGCNIIRVQDPSRHDIGMYLHMAAEANRAGDLEVIQIVNNVKDPVKEIEVI